ncbi:hypothetical protein NHJ13734_008248 [Beauveria thailandica]
MSVQKPTKFDSFSKLPEGLFHTSVEITKYAGDYLDVDKHKFDWKSFKQSLDRYKGDDLSFDRYKEVNIDQQQSTVKTMVDQIVNYLSNVFSITLSAQDIKSLTSTIQVTFTSLKEKSSHGFLHFNESSDETNSSWEYRIQFAFPNPDTPDYFYALITTITLKADITDVSEWWGLVASSSKNFSAEIKAMELIVQKGFKNPNQ